MIDNPLVLYRHRSLPVLAIVIGIHAIGIAAFANRHSVPASNLPAGGEPVIAFIHPTIKDAAGAADPRLPARSMQVEFRVSDLHIQQPQIDAEVARNAETSSAAPSLIETAPVDMSPYIQQATLVRGEGVTVVLRIEVLESGEPGRIEVDASSGRPLVDEAAIAYARTLRWNAGRIDGVARAIWIRWGVRLQA